MNKKPTRDQRLRQLHKLVSKYLDDRVTRPSFQTIDKNFFAQHRLVDILLIVNLLVEMSYEEGAGFDKDFLRGLSKEEIEKRIRALSSFVEENRSKDMEEMDPTGEALRYSVEDGSRKYLLPYLSREINWIAVSILSASYVSSLILMRSVFELIIGIASKSTESMGNRIDSIVFLNDKEKNAVKKLWYRLCSWGHPYGKWVKEICPIYAEKQPLYHPKLCELCLQELEEIVDLFAVVAIAKYEIEITLMVAKASEMGIDLRNLKLLQARKSA